MKNINLLITGVILLALLFGAGAWFSVGNSPVEVEAGVVKLHKDPNCGCCGAYVSYLKKQGYNVEVHDTANLSEIKRELGVPEELWSCHTSEMDGYVVEGHMPIEAIEKMMSENHPDIKGIGLPGMPSGSPGMPGPKHGPFMIESFGDGNEEFLTL